MSATDYRVSDAAEHFKVQPRTIRDWINAGKLPGSHKVPDDSQRSEWRIPAETIEAVHRRKASAQPIPDDLDALMDRAIQRAA